MILYGVLLMGHTQISLCKYEETHLIDELTNTKKSDECLESKQIINYLEKKQIQRLLCLLTVIYLTV